MIIVSCRKRFDNSDRLSATGNQARNVCLADGRMKEELSLDDLPALVGGKRALLLVHGYNNEQRRVYGSYQLIEAKVNASLATHYDCVLGYSWPGGDQKYDWWRAEKNADKAMALFQPFVMGLGCCRHLDIMSHSLGARLVLGAMRQAAPELVRNYFCTAPAVDEDCFGEAGGFAEAVAAFRRITVFHSWRDGVLRFAYRAAEGRDALGLRGPEDVGYLLDHRPTVQVVNCRHVVGKHGNYKSVPEFYSFLRRLLDGEEHRQYVTLAKGS